MMSKLAFQPLLAAVASIVLATGVSPARAQPAPQGPADPYDTDDDADDDGQDAQDVQPAPPDQAEAPVPQQQQPNMQPPPPPAVPPSVPVQRAQPAPVQAAQGGTGQWVYTQQYGWTWMPYGDQYVYTPEASVGGYPYEYVYTPSWGWSWLAGPWVWGYGPGIYFSIGRPWYFGWYHHPHFVGRGAIGRGFVHGGFRGGFRGPAFRGGFRGGVGHVGGGFRGGVGHVGGGFRGHVGGHGHR